MKKQLFLILNLIVITFMANAQAPNAIPYQGVARNASGSVLASQNINLRISIHDGVPTGTIVFIETHQLTTTSLGLFNLNIGSGTQITGTLAGINWGSGAKYIQVELDALGGSTYVDMGTTQLNSVPYALHAGKATALPDGTANGNTLHWNGTEWLADNTITNDGANVGIGTATPGTKLDINGDMGLRSADIIIASPANSTIDVYSNKQSVYRLLQNPPGIGDFFISGLEDAAIIDGRLITLINSSGATMELYNDMIAHPYSRILTGTGNSIFIHNGGTVTFRYDATILRWEVIHSTYSFWKSSGNNISNINTGNVGIGTNTPSYKLDVSGDQRIIGTEITTPGLLGSLTSGGSLRIENNADNFFLKSDGRNIQAEKSNIQSSGTTASYLALNPFGGNVGIGTNNNIPYKLSIYQPAIDPASDNSFVAQLKGQNPILHFADDNNISRGYIKGISDLTGTPQFSRRGIEIGTGGGDIYLTAYANEPSLMIDGTTNNVGIGTNSPSHKLSVNGSIRAKEIKVNIANWPDYVFADNYSLPSLEEVESFIKKNKHLPGISKATTLESEGMDVSKMQTLMMEKIEELTLYLIEANKKIEDLKKENEIIKKKINL